MEEVSEEEKAAALDILAGMDPEAVRAILDAFENSASGEEFINQIMVGDCPKCGSSKTADCENDPEIADPCVVRCFDCGQLWCPDCGELFTDNFASHECPAWEDIDFDDEDPDDLE